MLVRMIRETVIAVLDAEGSKGGPKGYPIPEERELTVYVGTPGDVLQVARVTRVEAREVALTLETAKGERFYFAYEDVLGLRFGAPSATRERAAGFGR